MNDNYTIPAFAEPITGLPDTPTCAADELKRRFQAPADEVREAHNALAEAHETLDAKVEGIVTETFAGAIHESMFDEELTEKLNSKADEASVAERLEAETAAREAGDAALDTRVTATEAALLQKCEFITGTYTGNWSGNLNDPWTQTIKLGFQPKALLVASETTNGNSYSIPAVHLALPDVPSSWITITETGFTAGKYMNWGANGTYRYIAFK